MQNQLRQIRAAALSLMLCAFLTLSSGCGSGGSKASPTGSIASRGRGKVAFTIHWPAQSAVPTRLLPTASKAIKFSVVESEAPNNIVVLTKTAARPTDGPDTSTVLLDGLPTVLVTIRAEAYPTADATGVVQASGTLTVSVEQNKTLDKSITLDSAIKTVEVTAAAPVTIGSDGKFSLNLSDQTSVGSVKAQLTATAYNAAHDIVLTALDKWVYRSGKPDVASVSDPTPKRSVPGKTRAEGIGGAQADVTAIRDGESVITITETESQVATQVTASVVGGKPFFWSQQFGDAQNSSCSSGRRAAGTVATTFEVADPDLPGAFLRVNPFFLDDRSPFVESPSGSLTFHAENYSAAGFLAAGMYTTSKEGALQHFTPQRDRHGAFGPDGTYYTEVFDFANHTDRLVATGASSWVMELQSGNVSLTGDYASHLTVSGDGSTLYFTARSNRIGDRSILYAVDAHNGQIRWQTSDGDYLAKPAVSLDNATVYCRINTPTTGVVAFDAASGAKRWENADIGGSGGEADFVGVGPTGTVYSNGFTNRNSGSLRAINPTTGETLWIYNNASIAASFVLSRNGNVYGAGALSSSSDVFALNGVTGAVLWKKQQFVDSLMMGAGDGTLYFSRTDGAGLFSTSSVRSIVALDGNTGTELFAVTPPTFLAPGNPALTLGYFNLHAVDGNGTLYASTYTSAENFNHNSSAISVIR